MINDRFLSWKGTKYYYNVNFFSLPRPIMKVFPNDNAIMIAKFEMVLIVIQQNSSLFLCLFYLSSKRWSFAW